MSFQDRIDLALWAAWRELNEIRARDGIPWTHQGCKAGVHEPYFYAVVDELADILGSDAKPWPPKRCIDAGVGNWMFSIDDPAKSEE